MLAARTLLVQAGDEDHHRIAGTRCNQAQQTDPFLLAQRQIQDDDVIHMLDDAATRLLQRGGAVGNETERRHRAGDDQALDGLIVHHQETACACRSACPRDPPGRPSGRADIADRHEEAVKPWDIDTARCKSVFWSHANRSLHCRGAGPAAGRAGGGRADTAQSRFFITSDGVRLHYLEAGPRTGHTIVFVPGWTMPAWIWEPQISAFAQRYHVVAFDPRGQGESDVPARATSRAGAGRTSPN